jgi:hypothetical protein
MFMMGNSDAIHTFDEMKRLFPLKWCESNLKEFEPQLHHVNIKWNTVNKGMDVIWRIWTKWNKPNCPPLISNKAWEMDLSEKGRSVYEDKMYNRLEQDILKGEGTMSKKSRRERTYEYLVKNIECPRSQPSLPPVIPVLSNKTLCHVFDWNIDCVETKNDGDKLPGCYVCILLHVYSYIYVHDNILYTLCLCLMH